MLASNLLLAVSSHCEYYARVRASWLVETRRGREKRCNALARRFARVSLFRWLARANSTRSVGQRSPNSCKSSSQRSWLYWPPQLGRDYTPKGRLNAALPNVLPMTMVNWESLVTELVIAPLPASGCFEFVRRFSL